MQRKYGMFVKVGNRWKRMFPHQAYHKPSAIRIFQSLLLHCFFKGKKTVELRIVKEGV